MTVDPEKINMPYPRVRWDADAQAAYLYVRERGPEELMGQDDIGGCIIDSSWNEDTDIIGVEMLVAPTGADGHIPAAVWVLAGRAWERAQEPLRTAPKGIGVTGMFTLAVGFTEEYGGVTDRGQEHG